MKNTFALAFVSAMLIGCGGGGNPSTCSGNASSCAQNEIPPVVVATPPPASTQGTTLCGVDVGAKLLEGTVTGVHDGDTITLNAAASTYKIRLDSIDAPELAQPFGSLSQSNLSNGVLGKAVKVAYTKTDQYDRIVGAVFTDSCRYVNLDQVSAGMAWFYKAYQCEISAGVRNQFAQAQDNAADAKLGLWSQTDPEAPWFFRNGSEPVTPICKSDSPAWSANSALTSIAGTTTANSSTTVPAPTGASGSTSTCFTGPRGGTYTLTASGNKNYSGC